MKKELKINGKREGRRAQHLAGQPTSPPSQKSGLANNETYSANDPLDPRPGGDYPGSSILRCFPKPKGQSRIKDIYESLSLAESQ